MSFDDTGREPEQAFRLNRDPAAELEYPTKWEHAQCFLSLQQLAALKQELLVPPNSQINIGDTNEISVSGTFKTSAVWVWHFGYIHIIFFKCGQCYIPVWTGLHPALIRMWNKNNYKAVTCIWMEVNMETFAISFLS